MRGLMLSLVALVLAAPAYGQEGCTFTFAVAKEMPDSLTDSSAVYLGSEPVTVSVAASPDSLCHVTDADGFDGAAEVQVPEGSYTVLARSVGKKGASVSFGDVAFERGKGKPVWEEVALDAAPGASWTVSGTAKGKAQVRLIAAEAPPPEE